MLPILEQSSSPSTSPTQRAELRKIGLLGLMQQKAAELVSSNNSSGSL